MISPEVREDAFRFQDRLLQQLIDTLCGDPQFECDRWPFSTPQMAVITACAYGLAFQIMLAAIRDHLPEEQADREIAFLTRAFSREIHL